MRRADQRRDVVVVGRSCRLPGASSVGELWSNLKAGRCSVTQIPDDRWQKAKHGHPRPKEPGKSYTWAAGILDDIWSFDPAVFGISPREADQMDPQQRLILELTWEAIEDAGIARSRLAGQDVGVFVGASSPEYTVVRNTDIAGGDAYTATGGAISIISNRVSHAFDFRGPSFTVDTACSSSLVALHQAVEALRSGRIDTAIVAGINLLMSPFGFVIFSQASMLSPTGRCQTFDAKADGYVRAEGAVAFVLQSAERAAKDGARSYARIAATGVNSDGRTNGIALPSRFSQARLLEQVYAEGGIDPADMAFVEAHGTGTRVGDPIEAFTIGEVIGKKRAEPLLVGSIKSNIGHLEPASGLAGMLKAMLALEHDLLPPSVNYREPNPEIPFEELNLAVCAEPTALRRNGRPRFAGINSFGFGGTNAHAVICDPEPAAAEGRRYHRAYDLFAVTGASRGAVRDLARQYSTRLAAAPSGTVQEVAAAATHRRDMLAERAVVEWRSPRDLVRKLEAIADKEEEVPGVSWGSAAETDAAVAFVFSGNGGQWPGMGRSAYAANRTFREAFDEVDTLFDEQFGWSVTEALFAADLDQRLQFTHVAQPLIFAIQIATSRALAADGLVPSIVLGHSVGEIAAAAIAGALSLRDAVRVIHARSAHQELARDAGRMGVVVGSREQVEELASGFEGVDVAAFNSPRTFTVAGPTASIKALGAAARKRRMAFRQLDLDYPFHCALIDRVREPLLRDIAGLKGSPTEITMVSTVTGEIVDGPDLDAGYWWRNVREPVNFSGALEVAARSGGRVFVEIGPRSVLLSNIQETLEPTALPFSALGVLEKRDEPDGPDPIRPAVVSAFARGAAVDLVKLFGPDSGRAVPLPTYPWQRRDFRIQTTPEAVGFTLDTRWHRLIGSRVTADGIEWTGLIDTAAIPELADHVVGGQPILPASAFIEIALTVARDWFETESAALLELDIFQPLQLEHDRSKEVKARLSPNTNAVEILSRARLSRSGWQLHAVAKITAGAEAPIEGALPAGGEPLDVEFVYRAAESVGLHYGPEFRLLQSVERVGASAIKVALKPSSAHGDYRIDPARLDACFHGLFVLFADLGAAGRGTGYLPVRFGHVRLAQSGVSPASALIEIRKAGERSIVSDFTLFDAAGRPIAKLDEVRFQAARIQRLPILAERALVMSAVAADGQALGRSGVNATAASVLQAAGELGLLTAADAADSPEQLLLEGWATSAAYAIARGFDGTLSVSAERVASLPHPVAAWLFALLHGLEMSGLATPAEGGWTIVDDGSLPPPALILRTLAAEHPNRSAEILLAAAFGTAADAMKDGAEEIRQPLPATVEGFELGGTSVRAAGETLGRLAAACDLLSPGERATRVLQVGYGPLSHEVAALAAGDAIRLSILEPDARRLERARLTIPPSHAIQYVEGVAALEPAAYDLVLVAEGLHRLGGDEAFGAVRSALAPGGLLLAIEPAPSQFRDLTLGLEGGWFDAEGPAEFPMSPLRSEEGWAELLSGAGFAETRVVPVETGRETALLVVAEAAAREAAAAPAERRIRIVPASGKAAGLATQLDAILAMSGHRIQPDGTIEGDDGAEPAIVLFVAEPPAAGTDDVSHVQDICLALKACAEDCGRDGSELWIVAASGAAGDPSAAGATAALLAFSRTLVNEMAPLAVRRIHALAGLADERLAEAIRSLVATGQIETDFEVGPDGIRVARVDALGEAPLDPEAASRLASRLERGSAHGLAGLTWSGVERAKPAAKEVEIAVEASGLNFRDVMWAMSLLPDDILEDGFAGPTLGLECAGRVTAVGPGVKRVKKGDRVLAFAPSAFASSVSVPENVVLKVPEGLDTEAAATIPVAFLTAYYGLVTLANLKAGEWVLIHGAAGGVGLAALQIAQHRGARIIATAGSVEKRALLDALGADHVLNSRSSSFADDIRELRPEGVDVVLNSLAGEAMERGLSTLRPFGRFIELGKRDYVANTRIGLRPFRRNLSYFGVDVDQLLSDRDRASEIFAEVIGLFEEGVLKPLPYRVYPASETIDAFRLMQQSGHIGKIVIKPAPLPETMPPGPEFRFDPGRTHLLTGGFGGFGLETARWLADRGVRHLVLTGRNGPATEEARALVAELEARGVEVRAVASDVTDERKLKTLLAEIRRDMPPLAGIMHAAMVLEDSLLQNLTAEQFRRVLLPKVAGARHLDRLTTEDELDYFVLFSSITTFVGNPGQAAYVAANGYLEGLARSRRARGLPALALAWGAISDVGVLARQKGLAESLAKRVGVKAMPAREALDLMVQALSRRNGEPVMAIGSLDWSAARRLPALASPTFAALVRDGSVVETSERQVIDLRSLIATLDADAVRKQVVDVVVEEIATVLRVPKPDVALGKRLSEIGLDSLMAIELATALQDRFDLGTPPTGSVGALTVPGLAEHIIASVQAVAPDDESRVSQALYERHAGIDGDVSVAAPVIQAIQAERENIPGLLQ